MRRVDRVVKAPPDQVWDVLADGWLYPLWVVGASRMRTVAGPWPEAGAELHHSVGAWPALIDDTTTVLECQPGSLLKLTARAWPSGEATVTIRLAPQGAGTRVELEEDVSRGPARLVPTLVRQPLLSWRNVEALRRLAFLAERRAG